MNSGDKSGGVLVIAYGNPLRSDDGVAWRAAEEIRTTFASRIEVVCRHQLTPELAENASQAHVVIFVDATARGNAGEVVCQSVTAESREARFSHHLTPSQVLALCDRWYGVSPPAFVISISGECFDHGDGLSAAARSGLRQSVRVVSDLISALQPLDCTAIGSVQLRISEGRT
jgi:hydrogenase maturation protease